MKANMEKTPARIIGRVEEYELLQIEVFLDIKTNYDKHLYHEFEAGLHLFNADIHPLLITGACLELLYNVNKYEVDFSNSQEIKDKYFPDTNFFEKYKDSKIFRKQGIKIYKREEIQTVHKRHHDNCNSVVYSEDGGFTWHSVPIDAGKWHMDWVYAFINLV